MSFIGRFLFHVAATALVFWLIEVYVLPGKFAVTGEYWWAYLVVGLVFGLLNFWVKPLVKVFMLPINILTLGFASLAINGILLFGLKYLLDSYDVLGVGIHADGWLSYLIAGVVFGLAHTIIHWIS